MREGYTLGGAEEDGAAVDVLPLRLDHRARARLRREDADVAITLQLRQEEVVELFRLHLLRAEEEASRLGRASAGLGRGRVWWRGERRVGGGREAERRAWATLTRSTSANFRQDENLEF